MADASKYFAIRRVATSSSIFTNIVAPIACSQVVIENGDSTNAQAVRSDASDSETEKAIPASLELTLRASAQCWNQADVVCAVKSVSGSGPVIVTFLR